jgi:hypothetical protein
MIIQNFLNRTDISLKKIKYYKVPVGYCRLKTWCAYPGKPCKECRHVKHEESLNSPRDYIIKTDSMFTRKAVSASEDLSIGEFVDWLLVNQPNVSIAGIDFNSGRDDTPLCLRLTGSW